MCEICEGRPLVAGPQGQRRGGVQARADSSSRPLLPRIGLALQTPQADPCWKPSTKNHWQDAAAARPPQRSAMKPSCTPEIRQRWAILPSLSGVPMRPHDATVCAASGAKHIGSGCFPQVAYSAAGRRAGSWQRPKMCMPGCTLQTQGPQRCTERRHQAALLCASQPSRHHTRSPALVCAWPLKTRSPRSPRAYSSISYNVIIANIANARCCHLDLLEPGSTGRARLRDSVVP